MGRSATRLSFRFGILFSTGSLLLAAVTYFYFGAQVRSYVDLRRHTPQLWWRESPRPLADAFESTVEGTTLSYFGYEFAVPWPNIVKEFTRYDGRQVTVLFDSGQEVLFWDPAASQSDSLLSSRGSKYDHLNSVLSFTISGLSPFVSHKDFARQRDRWEQKGFMLDHSGATEIFNIQTPAYKGFEVSGLSYNGRVGIGPFDAADHQFLIEVQQLPGRPINTTQQDINRLIQSFRPMGKKPWTQDQSPMGRFGLYR